MPHKRTKLERIEGGSTTQNASGLGARMSALGPPPELNSSCAVLG